MCLLKVTHYTPGSGECGQVDNTFSYGDASMHAGMDANRTRMN